MADVGLYVERPTDDVGRNLVASRPQELLERHGEDVQELHAAHREGARVPIANSSSEPAATTCRSGNCSWK